MNSKGENMVAYKLIRKLKDGKNYPLFIGKTREYEFGKWLEAECIPTKGFAIRPGFHCCFIPNAPHLKLHLSNGEQRVWVRVEVEDWEKYSRPESQGGSWILAQRMRILEEITEEEAERIKQGGQS